MIETRIDGSPAAVRAAATWLRDTLTANVTTAGDDQQTARSTARSHWEGDTAESYQSLTSTVLKASDLHEARVRRAASALDTYAVQLQQRLDAMSGIRARAVEGELAVIGTIIAEPPAVQATVVLPGSPQEAEHQRSVARVELYNTLAGETATQHSTWADWVETTMGPAVDDAKEKDLSEEVIGEINDALPNFASGASAGLLGNRLLGRADDFRARAAEFRRRSRVSGNPAVRGQATRPGGASYLDDLMGKSRILGRVGRVLSGPGGIVIDIGFGIKDGIETGDWTRAALTTGTSIAVGLGVTALVAAGVVSAPVTAVVVAGGLLAAGASWGVGKIYDNWDDITGWTGDRLSDAGDAVSDAWDNTTDAVGDAWDAVTPW